MDKDSVISWSLANPYGIQVDDGATVWHSGCLRDVLISRSGATLVAADSGGVWSVGPTTAIPVADLDPPEVICLAQGPRSDDHVYAGGGGLFETDVTQGLPLLSWVPIPVVDGSGKDLGPGAILRVGVTRERRRLVLACGNGVFWAPMTYPGSESPGCLGALLGIKPKPTPPPPYVFTQVPILPTGGYYGLAIGSGDRVVVAAWGSNPKIALYGIFYGDFESSGLLMNRATILGSGFKESDMCATSLASCESQPNIMYAASSDSNGFFLGFMKSTDGGERWNTIDLKVTNLAAGQKVPDILGNQGNSVRPNNAMAVAPNNPDVAVLIWRNSALFITENGGKTWRIAPGDPHVHSDLHGVTFDPRDPSARTVLVGGDGGLCVTTDLGGTYDSSYNTRLATFQFESYPARMWYGSFSASPSVIGLIAGGLQDNGNVASVVQGTVTPWRHFASDDDGQLTRFVRTGRSLFYFNDDPSLQGMAWDSSGKPSDHSFDVLNGPGGPVGISNLAVWALRAPGRPDEAGFRMYAVGVYYGQPDSGDVRTPNLYAYYSHDDGSRGSWVKIADFGVDFGDLSAAGSFDGTTIFVGTTDGKLFRYDPASRQATPLGVSLKTANPGGSIPLILALSDREAYALYNASNGGFVLQCQDIHAEQMVNGLPSTDAFFGLEAFSDAENRLILVAASDKSVFVTRDRGKTWLDASSGLPRRPHCCDLCYVAQSDGNAFLYLGTYGRSAWVAQVVYTINVPPR